jgi:hypothetical protein
MKLINPRHYLLRVPKIFHLRRDPFERADENSNTYYDWMIAHVYIIYAMQIENFQKFPPRQKPASFNPDAVMRRLVDASGGGSHCPIRINLGGAVSGERTGHRTHLVTRWSGGTTIQRGRFYFWTRRFA